MEIKLDTIERQLWFHGYAAGRIDERKAQAARRRPRILRALRAVMTIGRNAGRKE